MKRLIALVTVILLSATPVKAETVRTCSSVYGGGEVCGETTTDVTVEHKTVAAGANDIQLWQVMAGVAGIALVSTILYKLSYRWYIFD